MAGGDCALLARYLGRPLPEVGRTLLFDKRFCCVDVETTGKDPHHPDTEIVEITIIGGAIGLPILSSLVRPMKPIPAEVTAIHGIRDEDVAGAPTFKEL